MPNDKREVNLEETVEVKPAEEGSEEETSEEETQPEEETETLSESSPEEKPVQEEPEEELRGRKIASEQEKPKPVEGETPRENALRLEVARVKRLNRELKAKDLLGEGVPEEKKPDITEDKRKVFEKYNPQELENLKEVLTAMADDLGFVKKSDYTRSTYQSSASEQLDAFLEKHPAYLPENDPDNVLWSRFKEEFSIYKQPNNPRDFRRLFDKIHKDIFGASSDEESLKKINAQKEKIKVASHSGTSSSKSTKSSPSGPKLDSSLRGNLKGFTDEELDEMFEE